MKTKKSKLTGRQEIAQALVLLHHNNISVVTIADEDFLDHCIVDQWSRNGVKPTDENILRARVKALDYIQNEMYQIMKDAIEYVAMKQSIK
jgi:hypothetical protein